VEVNIIPYHALGTAKYEQLGREYGLTDVTPPSEEDLERYADIFKTKGLNTKIL
jgi:pyruvate formate lyase activating enzyme